LDLPELQLVFREYADVPLVSISNAQRTPVQKANFLATVYHGIDLTQFTFNARPEGYLAFLGRAAPEKGLDTAIRVARRAGLPLKVAVRMPLPFRDDPNVRADWEYWEQTIQPLLGQGVEMIGEVSGARKDEFLRNAAALLFPIRWPEPFGLVMVEALACGTPVLALRAGSVAEVIRDGATGFIRDSEDGLVAAIGRVQEIDRATCRREAERRFSASAMADAYERLYARLVHGQPVSFDLGRMVDATKVQPTRMPDRDRRPAGSSGLPCPVHQGSR
jgi:glycosyltransferase involved in cell wall biosynthesis